MLYMNGFEFPVNLPCQWNHENSCEASMTWKSGTYQCSLSDGHDFDHVAVATRMLVGCWSDAYLDGQEPDSYPFLIFNGIKIPLLQPNRGPFFEYADGGCEATMPSTDWRCNRHDCDSHLTIRGGALAEIATYEFMQDEVSRANFYVSLLEK